MKQQMEEQKRRKDEEVRRKKEEEAREEERIQRERVKMEEEFRMEEQKKKAKVVEFQQANAHIVMSKGPNKRAAPPEEVNNFVAEKPKKADLFGNGPSASGPFEI